MTTRSHSRSSAAKQMKHDGLALFIGVALVVFVVLMLLFYSPTPL